MKMKTVIRYAASAAFAAAALIVLDPTPATAGVENTKHNLGSTGTGNHTTATGEICVFCHTPHGSSTTAAVPLWNRLLPDPTTFTTYDSLGTSTLDADTLAVGSVSLACLSCHDGSQALDALINAPGSGGYDPTAPSQGWTFTGFNQFTDPTNIALIGKDLQNDHPIGIRYAGGDAAASGKLTAVDDDFFDAVYNATRDFWWIDTEGTANGTRNSTDVILYTRDFSGSTLPSVECASCHDPHTENTTFLRIANTGSALCLTCHNK